MDPYANLRQGLVGAWAPCLGASGGRVLVDRSNYRNNGTLGSGMDPGTDWVSSRYGYALDFDGVDDRVSTPLLIPTTNLSYSVWFYSRLTSGTAFTNRACGDANSSNGLSGTSAIIGTTTVDQLYIVNRAGASNNARDIIVTVPNLQFVWHFLVVTISSGAGGVVYLDGVQVGSNSAATSITRNATWFIGSDDTNTRFNGLIPDCRVYNRVLTAGEIRQAYQGGPGAGLTPRRSRRANTLGSQFWLRDAGTWKKATPWINVGGTWKKAAPKLNVSGTWK